MLGGTFDPPHMGHLWLGETAHDRLNLDEVWFLPVGEPPHKHDQNVTAVSHRLNMTHLAIQSIPYFKLNTTDCERPHPHTTHSLLDLFISKFPGYKFWLLIGSDSLRDMPLWVKPEKIIQLCRLGVLSRPDAPVDLKKLEAKIPQIRNQIDWLDGPALSLSSTNIRQWIKAGHSIRFLIQPGIGEYISTNSLYEN